MARFIITGDRNSGYFVFDQSTNRRIGKKRAYGAPYKIYGAAMKRKCELEQYWGYDVPSETKAGPGSRTSTPKVYNLLPDELFDFE